MTNERLQDTIEEILDVQSLPELKALWCHFECEAPEFAHNDQVMRAVRMRLPHLRETHNLQCQIEELQAQLPKDPAQPTPPVQRTTVSRGTRKYKLLSTDVKWSTKPQVQALMAIIAAHVEVGQVVDESLIVDAVVANESLLQTKQGGKRIWDYYKGTHNEGLMAHGNVEKL